MTDEELKALAITHRGVVMMSEKWYIGGDVFAEDDVRTCLRAVPKLIAHIRKLEGATASPEPLDEVDRERLAKLRAEQRINSLGDRPHGMGAGKLREMIDLEARE